MSDDGSKAEGDAEKPVILQENLEAAFSVAAVYSNKTYLTKTPMGIRLTFMEAVPNSNKEMFRTAVYLNLMDAINLRKLIDRQMDGVEFTIEQTEKKSG